MKTPIFNIHDLILVLTLAVCVLLVVFQLLLSKQKMIASYLLSAFFIGVGMSALCNLLLWNDYIVLSSPSTKMALSLGLVAALVGKSVCLYLYVIATTRANFRLQPRHGLHLLHLLLMVGVVVLGKLDSDRLRFSPETYTVFSGQLTDCLWHYLKILPVVYGFAAVWVIRQYKQQLKAYYSTLSLQGPYWLMLLTLGFAVNWLWSLVVHVLGHYVASGMADHFGILDNYITFLLVNALFVYSLHYAHQLIETNDKPKEKATVVVAQPSSEAIEKIRAAMEEEQLFLKHNLTIEEFSRHLGIHYREVSNIINNHFHTNFFEFVNLYRVEKAKQMLLDPQFSDTSILAILLESGFNSKSSFHRFFKRYTGMSAADFRKQVDAGKNPLPT